MPELSVVIPTFNRAEMLRTAIESVLAQRDVDLELVVSDNCSTDHTAAVVDRFATDPRVRSFRNDRNLGMVANWRRAIFERARADCFVLLSDDDYFIDPTYLARAMRAMREHQPKFVYAGGVIEDAVRGRSTLRLPFDGPTPGATILASRGTVRPQDITLCNMLFRKTDAQRLGFPSHPDNLSCDSELYLMLCCEGEVFAIPEPVSVYRMHGGNLVSRINGSRRTLDRNLDHLVRPLAYGRAQGVSPRALDSYRVNARIDSAVSFSLLKLWLHDESWYLECRQRLLEWAPDVVADVEAAFGYRARRLLLAKFRAPFRRWFPLSDSGASTL